MMAMMTIYALESLLYSGMGFILGLYASSWKKQQEHA